MQDELDPVWSWMVFTEAFCKNLNYKPGEVYNLNYIDCLNWREYWIQKDKLNNKK